MGGAELIKIKEHCPPHTPGKMVKECHILFVCSVHSLDLFASSAWLTNTSFLDWKWVGKGLKGRGGAALGAFSGSE